MAYTATQRSLLERYFSVVDGPDHADVYLVRNLPQEVAATLNGVYSRSSKSMRDQFLDRLEQGLAAAGRSLDELVRGAPTTDALSSVMADKSGQFLKTYAIDHGHNSLREGSVVHLAVERVSQLVTRFIQRERRCSFEESSTRYISFSAETHWRDPDVVATGGAELAAYDAVLQSTFALYGECTAQLLAFLQRERPLQAGEKEGPWLRALKAEAFDAARYLLTPAIDTKWGLVADARTLSDIVGELLSHPLAEFRLVGERMCEQAREVLPTLLAHARPNEFLQHQHAALPRLCAELGLRPAATAPAAAASGHVTLLAHDPQLDDRLLASLLYESSSVPFAQVLDSVRALDDGRRRQLLHELMQRRGSHDAWPTGLEGAMPFDFEVLLDFGAYRDIGRHRKGFQQQQTLTVEHGFAVPPLIEAAGLGARYGEVLEQAAAHQRVVAQRFPLAAGYVTPFAFLQRVRVVFEPRQLAYFIELRSGPEGHFAYRRVAIDMQEHLQRVSPLFAAFVRARTGDAFLGRMQNELGADERRKRRMQAAGDA
ncbi:MAG: FAD-dependent thymidylate synthase [Planctomycetota bacterium]